MKDTYLDHSLDRIGISKKRIDYINSYKGIVYGLLNEQRKECTVVETMFALKMLSSGKIYFMGNVQSEINEMAWWVKKNNTEVNTFVKSFIKELKSSDEWNNIFYILFGVNYNLYEFILNPSKCYSPK